MCEQDGSDGEGDDVDVPTALKETCGEETRAEDPYQDKEGAQEEVAPIIGPGMVNNTFDSISIRTVESCQYTPHRA